MNLLLIKNCLLQLFIVVILGFVTSCNKENAFDCVKSTGKEVEKIIETDGFHSIHVEDNIDVELNQYEDQRVLLRAGRNIIPKIKFEVKEQVLYLSNENKCNWVRKFENPKVFISLKDLKNIIQNGSGNITSSHTLKYETFNIDNYDGNGDITLELDVENLKVFSKTFSVITLTGRATNFNLYYIHNFGKFHGEQLHADNVTVSHVGLNTVRVFPLKHLNCSLSENGNLEYYNEPEILESQITGTGQLIKRF